MGNNYYLWVKSKYIRGESEAMGGDDVEMLENGYVWKGRYYATEDSLDEVYSRILHIGKSSCGWVFRLCVYPALGIRSLKDWKTRFADSSCTIKDEEGRTVGAEDMVATIADREGSGVSEEDRLASYNRSCEVLGWSKLDSYEDYLALNDAVRGPRGLLSGRRNIPSADGGTYATTEEWDFS